MPIPTVNRLAPILALVLCTAQADMPKQLTLPEAKRIALAGSPNVKALLARVKAAEAVVGQSRSALRPQVNANAGLFYRRDVSIGYGDGDDTPLYQVGVAASWLLFDGFATNFRTAAAEAGVEATLAGWGDGQRLLAQGISISFLDCLLANETGRVAGRDAQFNRELLAEAEKRYEAGAGPRVDVLNFSVRVQTAENTLLGSQRQVRAARQTLAALLGLPEGKLPETTSLLSPKETAGLLPEADQAIAGACARRPDLRRYQHAMDQLKAAIEATRAGYKPTLVAQASYALERTEDPRFHAARDANSSIGLALSWHVFDGHLRKHTIAENKALLLATSEARNQLRIDIAADVRRNLDSAETVAKQYANQAKISGMFREIRDIVRQEYVAGLSPLTRLNEVQTDLVRAEGALSQARIRHQQALEALATATATNLPATD